MAPVFWLSLRQLSGRFRLGLILFLAALPVVLTIIGVLVSGDNAGGRERFVDVMLNGLMVAAILPLVAMTLATAAFGNELEDGTLSHLTLMPPARWRIALPKLAATLALCGPLLIASGVVATLIGFEGEVRPAIAAGVGLALGTAAYAAIFTWVGLVTGRGLAFALLYVLLWEGILPSFIKGINYLSLRGYTLAIMHGLDEKAFATLDGRVITLPVALVGAILVTAAFWGLTVRRLTRMDVP